MGSLWSTCDSEGIKEKETISLQPLEILSQRSNCKLGGASLLATSENKIRNSMNNLNSLSTSNYPVYSSQSQVKAVKTPALTYSQASNSNKQAQAVSKENASGAYAYSGSFMQYWLDGDSYDGNDYDGGVTYQNSPQIKPKNTQNSSKNRNPNNPSKKSKTFNRNQQLSTPAAKVNQKSTKKYISNFSDTSSDTSEKYSDFYTFILSYDPSSPKPNPALIPSSFQDRSTYIAYFTHAFYIELDAILEQALGQAFQSNNYRLNLNIEDNSACISNRDSDEALFESESRNNDIVLLIPDQSKLPSSFEELKARNIPWTLGIINKERNDKVKILLNPSRKRSFRKSRKYIATSIGNIIPLEREITILEIIDDLEFERQILNPQVCQLREKNIPKRFIETIRNRNYNESQVNAIKSSINSDGKITLIQGPPGTGKTTTVVGILSGLFELNRNIKVLICAQSNAAVDEIASTVLKKGIFDINGNRKDDISLLRIGDKRQKHELGVEEEEKTAEEIEMSVHSIRLSTKLEKLLKEKDPTQEIAQITNELKKLEAQMQELQNENRSFRNIKQEYDSLSIKLQRLRKEKNIYFKNKNKFKNDIVKNSDVLFCTLSTSDSDAVSKNIGYIDYLIIDEACQSLELSTLLPFQYHPTSVILIGDPKQLPATTFSEKSKINKYDRSMFERMMECGIKPILLSEQYRMMKEISDFTSRTFYNNQIKTGDCINYRPMPYWVSPAGLFFCNLVTSREKMAKDSMSYYNDPEAQFALNLYELLRNRTYYENAKIGIISPYKGQVQHIEKLLYKRYGNSWEKNCEVSSVDGFQGREVDIVIFSAVRSGKIGFLKDERRMNVAISRAKYGMYAIGNEACLSKNPKWKSLINYCKKIQKYKSCNSFERAKHIFNKQ